MSTKFKVQLLSWYKERDALSVCILWTHEHMNTDWHRSTWSSFTSRWYADKMRPSISLPRHALLIAVRPLVVSKLNSILTGLSRLFDPLRSVLNGAARRWLVYTAKKCRNHLTSLLRGTTLYTARRVPQNSIHIRASNASLHATVTVRRSDGLTVWRWSIYLPRMITHKQRILSSTWLDRHQ